MGIRNSLAERHKPLSHRWRTPDCGVEPGNTIVHGALANRVRRGLANGEFELAFQGIYHLGTGTLDSVEALIRWIHPERGLLLPSAFLSTMSDPLVAHELTYFVVARACRYLGERQRARHPVCPIAINVPPSIAARPGFAADVEDLAYAEGASPSLLEIELSETEDATALLATPALTRAFRDAGMRIAIDDFGTGFSSLASLGAMAIDTVKIARELMVSVPDNPRACAVMAGVITMLDELGVRIVVEGIETTAQSRWLARWPNLRVQGYLWGTPTLGPSAFASREHRAPSTLRTANGWL